MSSRIEPAVLDLAIVHALDERAYVPRSWNAAKWRRVLASMFAKTGRY